MARPGSFALPRAGLGPTADGTLRSFNSAAVWVAGPWRPQIFWSARAGPRMAWGIGFSRLTRGDCRWQVSALAIQGDRTWLISELLVHRYLSKRALAIGLS